MSVFISLYAAVAAYRLINNFRPKTSGSLFDTFKTAQGINIRKNLGNPPAGGLNHTFLPALLPAD